MSYRTSAGVVTALDKVSLEVLAGSSLAITGPSGCGKSTLLGLISGLNVPTAGVVRAVGLEVSSLGIEQRAEMRRRRFGLIFQTDNLLPFLTAGENVAAQLAMYGETDDAERCYAVLRELGLGGSVDRLPDQLSGGQRQRIAVARAIVHQPSVILADEPTGSLDAENSTAVMELLLAKQRQLGATVVVVTHDLALAAELDRQLMFVDGHVVNDSGPASA